MIAARVSNIEAFRQWLNWKPFHENDIEPTIEEFVERLTSHEPSEAMLAGTAFHKALELAKLGDYDNLEANGYLFKFADDIEIEQPIIREFRANKKYGGLLVTGQVDGVFNNIVIDYKTTKSFDADRYLSGYQWRFYLDLLGLDVFQWNVFVIKENEPNVYIVKDHHVLKASRYPELTSDCETLAAQYYDFAKEHMPKDYSLNLIRKLNIKEEAA